MRRPGKEGVNVTDSVQLPPGASVAVSHVDAPAPLAKSRLDAPSVRTLTLLTVPPGAEVTVTFCAPEVDPTGSELKELCARKDATVNPRRAITVIQIAAGA
jgi:hypothetical protein